MVLQMALSARVMSKAWLGRACYGQVIWNGGMVVCDQESVRHVNSISNKPSESSCF